MKFECGMEIEAQELKKCRELDLEIPFWEQYREHNRQELAQLLKKRMAEGKTFAERNKEKLVILEQAEQKGVLVMKK